MRILNIAKLFDLWHLVQPLLDPDNDSSRILKQATDLLEQTLDITSALDQGIIGSFLYWMRESRTESIKRYFTCTDSLNSDEPFEFQDKVGTPWRSYIIDLFPRIHEANSFRCSSRTAHGIRCKERCFFQHVFMV